MWQFSSLNEPFEDTLVALKSCRLCFENFLCISLYSMCFGILLHFYLCKLVDYLLQFWMSSKVFAHSYDVFLFECHMVLRFRVQEGFRHVVVIYFSCFWMAWFWNKIFQSKFHISKLISKWSLFWVEVQVWSLKMLFIVSNLCFFGCSFVLVVAC